MNTKLLTTLFKVFVFAGMFSMINAAAQPIITLNGNAKVYVELHSNYVSLGATAYDSTDGDITSNMTYSSDVTTSTVGIYTEQYSVTNSKSQTGTATRFVYVVNDLTLPVITLYGDDTVYIEASRTNANFTDPGAMATDNLSPYILTSSIVVDGQVNTRRVGIYTLKYNVSDISNNKAIEKIRTVIVRDTRAPQWINARSPHNLYIGDIFLDSVDIVDAYDNDINFTVSSPVTGPVNTLVAGQYDYIYVADADSSGNRADTLFVQYIVQNKVSVTDPYFGDITIYPTLFNDALYINLNDYSDQFIDIELFDVNGRKMDIKTIEKGYNEIKIDGTELSSGMYYIKVHLEGQTIIEKVIKE